MHPLEVVRYRVGRAANRYENCPGGEKGGLHPGTRHRNRARDIDMVSTLGFGFPAWRGGPLFSANEVYLPRILHRLNCCAKALGNDHVFRRNAPLLRRLAAGGDRIRTWAAEAD